MRLCGHCGSANADLSRVCQSCGHNLDGAPGQHADATVRWRGHPRLAKPLRRTVTLQQLFGGKQLALIGRAPECELCLPHPSVSRHHALLTMQPAGIRLEDLASVNGVLINGRRIGAPLIVGENQRIGIGPFLLRLAGGELQVLDNSQSLRLEARGLEKTVALPGGQKRKLLDNINLAVEPGEFVSLLGPSGSGKSTLMDCLNGRRPATGGRVLANGEDFYLYFDNFRQSLGYVPQRDIVHTQLPVHRALYYTARLRLPSDTTAGELGDRIDAVVEEMELGPHVGTMIGQLSGGQVKRVSLGAELLARPCLLYIDEATSGLDAGTEARMMRLFRNLADEGRSVLCITHNVDNVDLCHLILVLARGRLVYFGPPAEARAYFSVGRISEIYDTLAAREPEDWEKQFAASSLHREYVTGRLEDRAADAASQGAADGPASAVLAPPPPRTRRHTAWWHQFKILTRRYVELIVRDRHGLRLLLLQAPIVALVILCGFVHKPYEEKMLFPRKLEENERHIVRRVSELQKKLDGFAEELHKLDPRLTTWWELPIKAAESNQPILPVYYIVNPRFTYMLLFLLVVIVLWFGCNNASKEIVKEEAIYSRERAVNLGLVPYLASKFVVLSGITALQALVLMICIYGPMELMHAWAGHHLPYHGYRLSYAEEYGILVILGMTGVAMGLLLSALVSSPDQANALLPYVLIPQIILGGGFLPVREGVLYVLAIAFSPAYWAYRGIHRGATRLPPDFPVAMNYNDSPWVTCAALAVQIAVLLLLSAWFLRRKETARA